jgi:outer membrane protein assembly factor BamB
MKPATLCALLLAACNGSPPLAYQSGSPWPKFRGDAAQDGRSAIAPSPGGAFWTFPTGKGVFSSPVIAADGTIYVGSADRTFYALNPDGTLRWKLLTGEIIDSAALLDDRDRVYFGSGDGNLRALDAATGAEVWTTPADPPSVNSALINWFEGNVALSASGELYVPNDNWFVYTVDRATGAIASRLRMPDQTWSLPAVDAATGRFFLGNNNVVQFLGSNLFAFDANGGALWDNFSSGSIAASPMLAPGGLVVVGGFDGFVRGFDQTDGTMRWSFGARDHLYASPARLSDGTVLQAATDGTLYALDPATGVVRWSYDTRDPIRSSPAVDAEDRIYFGSGDGRLYVLNGDGMLRWSVALITADRNDVNASPALGRDAVYIAGESGEVFSVPYDYCLGAGQSDPRCAPPPDLALPSDGARLLYTTEFGAELAAPPATIDPNQPIVLSLVVRQAGRDVLALLDPSTVSVAFTPPASVTTEVAGNGKFLIITPSVPFAPGALAGTVSAGYLVDPMRDGLKLSGGTPGGTATLMLTAQVSPPAGPFTLPIPGGTWEVSRLALPLPTLLPSYNQIGFDSLHYLVGLVEGPGPTAVAWMVGAKLAPDENRTIIDPATRAIVPLSVSYQDGFVTFANQDGVSVEVTSAVIPFKSFRLAAALGPTGDAAGPLRITGSTICGDIALYGLFLQRLGLCNPTTDELLVSGAANFTRYGDAPAPAPGDVGAVAFSATADTVTATLSGSSLKLADHVAALLLVDPVSGQPVSLDYGLDSERTADGNGNLATVAMPISGKTLPALVRVHLMIDVSTVADGEVAIP